MNDDNFEFIESFIDRLKSSIDENIKERNDFLLIKLEEIKHKSKQENYDLEIFANYISDIGKGLIPLPIEIEHDYPGYPIFYTHKDGSFCSGNYETWQLWRMKKLNTKRLESTQKNRKMNKKITKAVIRSTSGILILFLVFSILSNIKKSVEEQFCEYYNVEGQTKNHETKKPCIW